MHHAAYEWVSASRRNLSACELGSRDVNGSVRDLFPGWAFVGVDVTPGPGVDVVADAATWDGDGRRFDLVLCCEVLEHDPAGWRRIVANAHRLLQPGGWFVVTAAGPGRVPHACDGDPIGDPPREPYANVYPAALAAALAEAGFEAVTGSVTAGGADVRATARKPYHPGATA